MGILVVELHVHVAGFHLGIGVGKVEVLNVPRTNLDGAVEVAFLADVHQVDVLAAHIVGGHLADGVALSECLVGLQVFLEFHVRVERVVFRY